MPQGKKLKSAEEILGISAPLKSAEEILGLGAPSKPQPTPEAPQGVFDSFQTELAGAFLKYGIKPAAALGNAVASATGGNFQPLKDIGESVGRGALNTISAFDPAGNAYGPIVASQAPRLEQLRQAEQSRLPEPIRSMEAGYNIEAAKPRTRAGKVAGVVGGLVGAGAPVLAAGVLSGGSLPVVAGTAALQSAGDPENLALNVGSSVVPLPVGKLVAPILRRIRGIKGEVGEVAATLPTQRVGQGGTEIVNLQGETPRLPPNRYSVEPEFPVPSQQIKQQLGRDLTLDDIGDLAGAPRGAKVRVQVGEKEGRPTAYVEVVDKSVDSQKRQIVLDPDGSLSVYNDQLMKAEGQPAGFMRATLDRQVEAARRLGVKYIDSYASGRPNDVINGYYTLPTLGFDGPLEAAIINKLPANLQGATTVQELFALPGGSEWWKRNGEAMMLSLDTGAVPESAGLTENYNPQMKLPTLEAAPEQPFGVSLGKERPRQPGAVGPSLEEMGYSPGADNPGIVKPQEKDGFFKTLGKLFQAGLLTKPNTHTKNLGYNTGFAISEEVARVPGSIIDIALSSVTGQRTFTGLSPGAVGRSAREAATKGLSEAWQIIKNGVSDADADRLALKELNSSSKILNTYVKYVFRLLNAEDKVFNVYATRRALEDRARSIALTEIRGGKINRGEYGERVRELVDNPTEQLASDAKLDAEIATFTNPNKLATGITNFKQALGPGGQFVSELAVPFVKTPTNVIARILDYTPVGVVKGNNAKVAINILKRADISPETQRKFAQSFGRAGTGSLLIGLGWLLYKGGVLTGFREDDPTRRARDEAAGRTPGALLVGDKWVQIVGTSPFGNLMAIGATIGRETDQERDDALGAFLETPAQFIGEQPLMAGAQQISSALKQPGSFVDKTLGGIASGFVPGIVSDVAQTIDPTRRQADTFLGRIENRIPGLKQTLPEKPDVLGRSVQLPFPVDPTKSTAAQDQTDPLFRELVRLDQGISGFEKKKTESEQEFAEKVKTFGQLYGQYGLTLINSPSYRNENDVAKQEIFDLFNQRLKTLITENQERFANAKLSPPILLQAFRESQLRKKQKANQGRR